MARKRSQNRESTSFWSVGNLVSYHSLVIIFCSIVALGLFYLVNALGRPRETFNAPDVIVRPVVENPGVPTQQVLQRVSHGVGPTRIGIVAGHHQSDSGAVCDDGLQEVTVNLGIAERVYNILTDNNYSVEILAENDAKLPGYTANALISIHADSCVGAGAQLTGFKIAAADNAPSLLLQQCMQDRYGIMTNLPYNANTITNDMHNYHVFNKVSGVTPSIIIETGFMNLDRSLLVDTPEVPAAAIAAGLFCFLERVQ